MGLLLRSRIERQLEYRYLYTGTTCRQRIGKLTRNAVRPSVIVLSRTITFVKHAELFIRNEYQQCQGMKLWFLGLVRGFVERFNLDEVKY